MAAGAVWFAGGCAMTVFLPVRSSLYAVFPSVGAAIVCGSLVESIRSHAVARQPRAAADLALGERDLKRMVEADDLSGGAHLGAEHRIDPRKARERKNRLLDAHVVRSRRLEAKAFERFARHDPCRDLGDRDADHLGDEGHGA